MGSGHPAFEPYHVLKSKNGYMFIGCSNDGYWQAFCKALDSTHLPEGPRFKTNDLRLENCMGLRDLIEGHLAGYTTKEILQRIGDIGIPHSPVNDFEQLIQDPPRAGLRAGPGLDLS